MLSRPSLKRERSLSPSTMLVDSEDQSDSSFGFNTPRPQTSKSAKCSKGSSKWDDFSFPTPPGLKNSAKSIPENLQKQVIRDVYTCMRAKCGDEKISSNDFITVSKKELTRWQYIFFGGRCTCRITKIQTVLQWSNCDTFYYPAPFIKLGFRKLNNLKPM